MNSWAIIWLIGILNLIISLAFIWSESIRKKLYLMAIKLDEISREKVYLAAISFLSGKFCLTQATTRINARTLLAFAWLLASLVTLLSTVHCTQLTDRVVEESDRARKAVLMGNRFPDAHDLKGKLLQMEVDNFYKSYTTRMVMISQTKSNITSAFCVAVLSWLAASLGWMFRSAFESKIVYSRSDTVGLIMFTAVSTAFLLLYLYSASLLILTSNIVGFLPGQLVADAMHSEGKCRSQRTTKAFQPTSLRPRK